MANANTIKVVITGAAGQIAYSLIGMVARGDIFGADAPVLLHLLDVEFCKDALRGVVMEIEDCALPNVRGIVGTVDPEEAFKDADYCILVGAFPRKDGMQRKDLLEKNASIFKSQGEQIGRLSKKTVKVLVVGNPANTNCLIAQACASASSQLDPSHFSALTRLDHNRAQALIARRAGVRANQVHNVCIWGNHSNTQYPDVTHGYITYDDGSKKSIIEAVNDLNWLQGEFVKTVQERGAAIIAARKSSSAASAAKAIVDHMRDWIFGTAEGDFVSMAIYSNGEYGVEKGLIYSYPVNVNKNGEVSIVKDLTINEFSQQKMKATETELKEERESAFSFLGL